MEKYDKALSHRIDELMRRALTQDIVGNEATFEELSQYGITAADVIAFGRGMEGGGKSGRNVQKGETGTNS